MPDPLVGLVLSGGFSSRMGRDKGSLPWEGGLLVHFQARRLAGVTGQASISCREPQVSDYEGPFPLIPDTLPSGGPMSGLLSAFAARPGRAWMVLSVDLPYLPMNELDRLRSARDPSRIATVFRQPDGILQPLAAIWEPSAAPLLHAAWEAGRFSLRRILEEHDALVIESHASGWQNLNTPESLPDRAQ